jgi:hypothetical protein
MSSSNSHTTPAGTSPRFADDHNAHCVNRIQAAHDWWLDRILEDRGESAVPPPALRVGEPIDE